MRQFLKLFNKVGGLSVLSQYAKAHVLLFAIIQTLLQGFSNKSLEIVRLSVNNRLLCRLRRKYKRTVNEFVQLHKGKAFPRNRSNKIWFCWLQGLENAPVLVKKCYQSLEENLTDKEIIVLTEENYREYVRFPEYIQKKIDSGIITRTHMSDLLRLELLIQYGGTWIDATVFCSGGRIPTYMFDSDLFFFQVLKPGRDGEASVMSSF